MRIVRYNVKNMNQLKAVVNEHLGDEDTLKMKWFKWITSIRVGNKNGYIFDEDANRIVDYFIMEFQKINQGCQQGEKNQ